MRRVVVGVAGGSASGKSTFVARLADAMGPGRVAVIRHDAYYRDRSRLPEGERDALNYDHPDALETGLLARHLAELREGRAVEIPVYDFTRHVRRAETVYQEPRPVVILDGILILSDARIRDQLDLAIFLDTPPDVRLARRLQRDMAERGRSAASVVAQYLETVRPMHLAHVEPSRRHADLVLTEQEAEDGIEYVLSLIRAAMAP